MYRSYQKSNYLKRGDAYLGYADLVVLSALLVQMKSTSAQVTFDTVRAFFEEDGFMICALNDNEEIVGVATLVHTVKLNGTTSRLEQVSVNSHYRGQGIGRELVMRVIKYAQEMKHRRIDLTTEPSRVAANKLYHSLGFELRETNVMRLNLSELKSW